MMGLTIYYSAISKSLDSIKKLSDILFDKAVQKGYTVYTFDEEGYTTVEITNLSTYYDKYNPVKRLRDVWLSIVFAPVETWCKYQQPVGFIDKPRYGVWKWIWNKKLRYRCKIPSRIYGLTVDNHACETFNFLWYKLGGYWVLDEFTKTAVGDEKELIPNTLFHIFIANFLHYIDNNRRRYNIIKQYVIDEGDYYDTGNVEELAHHLGGYHIPLSELSKISPDLISVDPKALISFEGEQQ